MKQESSCAAILSQFCKRKINLVYFTELSAIKDTDNFITKFYKIWWLFILSKIESVKIWLIFTESFVKVLENVISAENQSKMSKISIFFYLSPSEK